MELTPGGVDVRLFNRAVLGRAVRFLAGQGIDQFIDLGAGLPTVQNTHEVAQSVNPNAKVVYVDNDPMVRVHGRALLSENQNTTVITADLAEPDAVLNNGDLRVMLGDLGSGRFRSFDEVRGFFAGLELLEPGVVYKPLWRPDPSDVVPDPTSFAAKIIGAGIGRKP